MKLAETSYDNRETGCCAELDPTQWDGKMLMWTNKPFLRDHIRALFHIPLNFGAVATRTQAVVEAAEAYPDPPLWLSDEASPWRSDFYVALDRDVPAVETTTLSGTFVTKVFEGPYRDAGKWVKEMHRHVAEQGGEVRKLYFHYATCPKCAKRFGHNRVVLFAQVA